MRLFVAINLPDTEKQRLAGVLADLQRFSLPVRWLDPISLHLTLKFLGDVAAERCPEIASAIAHAARDVQPFDLTLEGFGTFPARGNPRVFWVGVEAPPVLATLQDRIERETERLGFPREARAFHAHITIGRVRRPTDRIESAAMDRIARSIVYNAVLRLESVELMQSHLSRTGARYEVVNRAYLQSVSE